MVEGGHLACLKQMSMGRPGEHFLSCRMESMTPSLPGYSFNTLLYCFPIASHLTFPLAVSHVLLKLCWLPEDSPLQIVVCALSEWAVHGQQKQKRVVLLMTWQTQGCCCEPTVLLGCFFKSSPSFSQEDTDQDIEISVTCSVFDHTGVQWTSLHFIVCNEWLVFMVGWELRHWTVFFCLLYSLYLGQWLAPV